MIAIKMIPCYGLLAFVGAFCIQFSMGKLDEKFIQFPIEDSKWNHLTSNDIKDLIIENFDDDWSLTNKIEYAVTTIVPANNTADHPLNKFVGAQDLKAVITREVLDSTPDKLVGIDSVGLLQLMKSILEQGFIRLDDALNKRWEVLKDLKHQRVIKELIFTKEKIRTLIESVVSKNSETEIWINVLTELQNSDLYNEIKKILSYPVVKEEMKREITSFDGDNNELTDFILSKLEHFISEGLYERDDTLTNKHTDELVKNDLQGLLIPLFKTIIEEGIFDSKHWDEFLIQNYENDFLNLTSIFKNEYSANLRMSLSIFFTFGTRIFHEEEYPCGISLYRNILFIAMKNIFRQKIDWEEMQRQLKNVITNVVDEKFMRRDLRNIKALHDLLNLMLTDTMVSLIESECLTHKKEHELFYKQGKMPELVKSIDKILSTEHADIKESDISLLKTVFIQETEKQGKTVNINWADVDSRVHLNFPEKIKQFQFDIEKEAVKLHNFTSGMFLYSTTYFDLLDKISPVVNSQEANSHLKTEL